MATWPSTSGYVAGPSATKTHAKDDQAARFYRRYRFEPSPIDKLTLMMLIKDIRP